MRKAGVASALDEVTERTAEGIFGTLGKNHMEKTQGANR
jgi:hypothetical protein